MRIILAAALLFATPASAWTVTHERDRMTDKTLTWASSKDQDATLLVGCMNGQPMARLAWDRPVGFGTIGMSWRVDAGPVVPRMVKASQDGTTLYAWTSDGVEWL